jgi:hypothetical protein
MRKIYVVIPIVFVAALIVSAGLQVVLSPDFNEFTREPASEPVVTYLPGEDGETQAPAGYLDFNWMDHPVFIIGDSLTQGAKKEIERALGEVMIDGLKNRNMAEGLSILREWQGVGVLPDDAIIVICLAHNITGSTLDDAQMIVDMIKPGQSLIMMTGHGNSNMGPVNEFIRGLPLAYSFITVADWDLTIAQSPGLLSSDGIHLAGKRGNELYADLILKALEVAQPKL